MSSEHRRMLFLDIDGVLNSERYYWTVCDRLPSACTSQDIDPDAVAHLNRIIDQSNCEVVLSSAWRGVGKTASVEAMLRERGFAHRLHASTPQLYAARHKEIWEIVKASNPSRFVVLDDDADAWTPTFASCGGFLVQTNFRIGLTEHDARAAITHLEGR